MSNESTVSPGQPPPGTGSRDPCKNIKPLTPEQTTELMEALRKTSGHEGGLGLTYHGVVDWSQFLIILSPFIATILLMADQDKWLVGIFSAAVPGALVGIITGLHLVQRG